MPDVPSHAQNRELFDRFRSLQTEFTAHLSRHPARVRSWLEAQPGSAREAGVATSASSSWRTARLNFTRRRDLCALLARAEADPPDAAPLAAWLLKSVPVGCYLEMADAGPTDLNLRDPAAAECRRRIAALRDTLVRVNYGLARSAARPVASHRSADLLGAACCGLLDAVDRYVPGDRAARFSYFASYWIRYHVNRHLQKHGSIVSFPVNQQRIGWRIDRYLASREAKGLAPPSDAELRTALGITADAHYRHRLRPKIVSLQYATQGGGDQEIADHYLCDPSPGPRDVLEESEAAEGISAILRAHASPAARVMLAYLRGVGSLPEAAEDYLSHLGNRVRERLGIASKEIDSNLKSN